MANIELLRKALLEQILEGQGAASPAQRRAAFDKAALDGPLSRLIGRISRNASSIGDQDIAAVLATGLSENQLFELAVCAAAGEASRQFETALAALDAATDGV